MKTQLLTAPQFHATQGGGAATVYFSPDCAHLTTGVDNKSNSFFESSDDALGVPSGEGGGLAMIPRPPSTE